MKDPGEFVGDIAPASDHHPLRQGFQMKNFVGSNAKLVTFALGHHRPRTDGDEDIPCGHGPAAGQLHRVGTGDDRSLVDDLHTVIFRSEEHTAELQTLMRISYAVFCLKTKTTKNDHQLE